MRVTEAIFPRAHVAGDAKPAARAGGLRVTLLAALCLVACGGTKPIIVPDAGNDDGGSGDSGVVDAGRVKGTDPATGWQVALPFPADAGTLARYGVGASMVLDQFKQPMIAALIVDPNSDGIASDNRLVFTRWDGVANGWQAPVTVEVTGDINVDHPNRPVSLARDSSTGRLGIVFPDSTGSIRYAWSDDEGVHWSEESDSAAVTDSSVLSNPVLAMQGGAVHLAYVARPATCDAGACGKVIHRTRASPDAGFTDEVASGALPAREWPIALALKSTGESGIAFFSDDATGAPTLSYFDTGAPVTIDSSTAPVTTAGQIPSVTLDLTSDLPSVAYHLLPATGDGQLWYAKASSSAGDQWGTPVAMPRNGPPGMLDGTQWYQALAYDGTGTIDVVGNFQNRTATGSQECGGPKFGTSTDGLTWTVCHPPEHGGVLVHTFDFAGQWVTMASHASGKVTIAFAYDSRANPTIGGGVVVYRQP